LEPAGHGVLFILDGHINFFGNDMSQKIAFLFPGQASQYVGMGKDLYEKNSLAKEYFDNACDILGYDIKKICFEGPEEELKQTRITQPAIFIHSSIVAALLSDIKPSMSAGHSLGEYSAVTAAKSLSFENGLKLVSLRGELMQKAGTMNKGTMAAIVGLEYEKVKTACENASDAGVVQPANFNSKDQIVISGAVDAVRKAMQIAKELGAKIAKELVVSGAFHSPLMEPAKEGLTSALNELSFKDAEFAVYANVTGQPTTNGNEIRENLAKQIISPVLWVNTINNMTNDGLELAIEVGPGKVIQGLVKKVNPSIKMLGVDKFEDIETIHKSI
jgi:[acyl-carrier-protein] S-malonyltransferase